MGSENLEIILGILSPVYEGLSIECMDIAIVESTPGVLVGPM